MIMWENGNKKKDLSGGYGMTWLAVLCVVFMIAFFSIDTEPKCIRSGCDNDCATGSSYCYAHKPYRRTYSKKSNKSTSGYGSGNTTSGSTGNRTSTSSNGSVGQKKSYTSKKSYESYDDGYDDIYMDDDYDDERYRYDSDYADGVDDAMDEFEEDW